VVGALLTPFVFWLVVGAGFGRSFQAPGIDASYGYLEYFFPGSLVMILLFTAIFSTISIIEDRREGFLQSVLVAPVSRASIVLGKILGATLLALFQGMLFLVVAPLAGLPIGVGTFLLLIGVMIYLAFGLTSLGFLIAWRMNSIQGFHAIMNLFLLPMWLLSGAVFPSSGAPVWIRWVMDVNPLTYGVALVRHTMYLSRSANGMDLPSVQNSLLFLAFTNIVLFVLAIRAVSRSSSKAV